jgi:enoyl-CoA hydratase/carnithine racemase
MAPSEAEDAVRLTRLSRHIALVELNRPEKRNAFNSAMASGLAQAAQTVEGDPDIRVAILTGAGAGAFSAGADLNVVAAGRTAELFVGEAGFAGFAKLKRIKPLIAALNGFALAGGLEIVLACDIMIASEKATFGLPEVKRGLLATAGGLFRLPRVVPPAIAYRMVATGEAISAESALAYGLISAIVPHDKLLDAARALAETIAGNAPLAVQASLELAREANDLPEEALWRRSQEAQAKILQTEDVREGATAFVEKRAPVWRGR